MVYLNKEVLSEKCHISNTNVITIRTISIFIGNMLDLKDICILKIVKLIKDGNLNVLSYNQILPLDLIEYLLTMLQKIEKWPLNNQFLEYLSLYSIESLDLGNQELINLSQWSNYLDLLNNNNNNNNNCNNNNKSNDNNNNICNNNSLYSICNSLSQLSLSGISMLNDQILSRLLKHFQRSLKSLKLSHCTLLDGSFIASFNQSVFKSIEYLNVRGCISMIPDNFLFVNIKELILSKTNVTNDDLSMFGNESTLRSNASNNRYIEKDDEAGGDVFISKPFRPNLVELILKMTTSKNDNDTTTQLEHKQQNQQQQQQQNLCTQIIKQNKQYKVKMNHKKTTAPMSSAPGSRGIGGSAPKKLVIKNLKTVTNSFDNYESESWLQLENAVNCIHMKLSIQLTLEDLYRMVENICLSGNATNLYKKLSELIEKHVKHSLKSLVGSTSDLVDYLGLLNTCWKDHSNNLILIMSIFLTLDRTYVIQNANTVKSIWDLGLHYFRETLLSTPELDRKLKGGLLVSIESERNGETVNRDLLSSLIKMMKSLHGNRLVVDYELPRYLKHVQTRLNEEYDRSLRYLDVVTRKLIVAMVEKHLIERHSNALIAKGFDQLIDLNRIDDLQLMYSILARVGVLQQLKTAWSNYIKKTGLAMVTDTEKESTLIQDLIAFKSKLDVILSVSYQKSDLMTYSLKESFENFMNKGDNRLAELIAKYIDSKLRSGNKGMTEDELEDTLSKALILFRYIQGKDVFEAFYKIDLSRRLLLEKSTSIDAEKSMVSKLRAECGNTFTQKLEGMFQDIELSEEIMQNFKQSTSLPITINVFVLTAGNWPTYTPMEALLPKEFVEQQELFTQFYTKKYSNRKLLWQNPLAHCILKATFPSGKKELYVSLFQTLILNQFNNADELTFTQIKELTGIEEETLKKNIKPLTSSKTRILNRKSKTKSKSIESDDLFSFNNDFTQKLVRIKVNAIQSQETVEENKKTNDGVIQDRHQNIDAAVVRIMKARKSLTHNLLIAELIQQLKFSPKIIFDHIRLKRCCSHDRCSKHFKYNEMIKNPYMMAYYNYFNLFEKFMEGAKSNSNLECTTVNSNLLFITATRVGNLPMIKYLIDYYDPFDNQYTLNNMLVAACQFDRFNIIKYSFEKV
ncbi:cullin [Heterostelium album PN500]|uniref:Cullin n=1 Tax=Heterostelium pallidum (strain ATCC 26659 / Pp 5 / PN500) TaxID=670386 RepID=D3B6I7_HETP5|nr:cullin [Heterostelium album PN500]EFA82957.1 cullin [Heterostelium album PN500]|eukprot:XP_020435074.1 cullin [Heterostelium album PN500]